MFIEIVKIPEGEAPKEVREKWVGCHFSAMGPNRGPALETLSRSLRFGKFFSVHALSALETLRGKSQEAAKWFEDNMELTPYTCFFFNKNECKITSYEMI